MAKDRQVNIRFDDETDDALTNASRRLGMSKSALVRHFTKSFLALIESRGGMPVDLAEGLADGRSPWGEAKGE